MLLNDLPAETGKCQITAIYADGAALTHIQDLGVENIEAYARPPVERCLEGLAELDVELLTPNDSSSIAGILAFSHPRPPSLSATA